MSNQKVFEHRRGAMKVTFVGRDGQPLQNQEVVIQQKKHEFLFGCSEFNCLRYVSGGFEGEELKVVEEKYKKFFEIFNFATLPFYWANYEREQGKPDAVRMKKAAQWFQSKGILLKGHPLCWHTLTAPWLLKMSNEEILKAQLDRIERDVLEFKGLIDLWDVINEVVIMPIFDKYDNGITRLCKDLGRIRTVREMFAATKKADPGATLLINDFETSESYDILVEGLLEAGIPIDAIGIQSHMHQGYWGIEKTSEIVERFSRFKLPIHFTENTIVSGKIMPREIKDLNDYQVDSWPSTPEGEERQAREVVEHYTNLFSHPLIASVTWWDISDGGWLKAPSGFVRQDGSAKPSYEALRKLIKEDWWMKPTTYSTDDTGSLILAGYLGDYEATCKEKTLEIKLCKSSENIQVVI